MNKKSKILCRDALKKSCWKNYENTSETQKHSGRTLRRGQSERPLCSHKVQETEKKKKGEKA